ncbi:pyridoxamine 5'-phosphate oxidase family protein [Nodosilinea sp. LEGE 07088]|nr:pyridoxamine 5'-phosphate oxidase family protein [Nodosilinea sp. LEGE 07088]MBE9135692.1 pyridoxamine 5'-phosphate oxidase family protein [Nodosilinea sp. LEGE 07088]
MLDIDEMGQKEIHELLHKVGHGHLGCIGEGRPYVVPMHYYLKDSEIYIFTTIGMKTQYMDANPEVCLQIEEIHDLLHWRSVVVTGQVERLTEQRDIDQAMLLVKARNPKLSPAINRTWIDSWGRAEVIAIYRLYPSEMSGRTTDGVSSQALPSPFAKEGYQEQKLRSGAEIKNG